MASKRGTAPLVPLHVHSTQTHVFFMALVNLCETAGEKTWQKANIIMGVCQADFLKMQVLKYTPWFPIRSRSKSTAGRKERGCTRGQDSPCHGEVGEVSNISLTAKKQTHYLSHILSWQIWKTPNGLNFIPRLPFTKLSNPFFYLILRPIYWKILSFASTKV